MRPCKLIEIFGMINPLQTTKSGRGIVSVRVALLLRFTEIKPCSYDLFRLYIIFLKYDMNSSLFTSAPLFFIRLRSFSFSCCVSSSGAACLELLVPEPAVS